MGALWTSPPPCFGDHPLQVTRRHFHVVRHEELLVSRVEAAIDVQHAAIQVYMQQEHVQEQGAEHEQDDVHEHCEEDPHNTVALLTKHKARNGAGTSAERTTGSSTAAVSTYIDQEPFVQLERVADDTVTGVASCVFYTRRDGLAVVVPGGDIDEQNEHRVEAHTEAVHRDEARAVSTASTASRVRCGRVQATAATKRT